MYLITGATGNVGNELVRALADSGEPVRALVRAGKADTERFPAGVETATGDLSQPDSLESGLRDVQGLFLLPGYPDTPEVLARAARAGARQVVLLSGASADGDRTDAISRYMKDSENAVRRCGLAWTILRPSAFMSNALRWVPQLRAGDLVRAPFAEVRAAVIDPHDIAAVAALALRWSRHAGQTYRLTGPRPLRPAEQVTTLAEILGRPLRFEAQPDAEARAEMTATMPQKYVDAFFSFYVDGTLDESAVLPTVSELTGRPPRTFQDWAHAHRAEFT